MVGGKRIWGNPENIWRIDENNPFGFGGGEEVEIIISNIYARDINKCHDHKKRWSSRVYNSHTLPPIRPLRIPKPPQPPKPTRSAGSRTSKSPHLKSTHLTQDPPDPPIVARRPKKQLMLLRAFSLAPPVTPTCFSRPSGNIFPRTLKIF